MKDIVRSLAAFKATDKVGGSLLSNLPAPLFGKEGIISSFH
jgi:hypothetical protein